MWLRAALRRFAVPTVAAVVVLPLWTVSSAAQPSVSPPAVPWEVVGEAAAVAAAVRSGQPVVVADKTSETEEVVANPDGTLTSTRSLRPVRVRQDGEWAPVDLTMVHREDGSIGPRAAAVDLRVSGGGVQVPLVVVGENGHEVGLGWSGVLPAPTLDGPTATYPEVVAGVDLTVTADVEGFTQLLVVKSREAALNPALRTVSFTNYRSGTTVTGNEDGLEVRSSEGHVVFAGDASRMWDSADRQASMAVAVSDTSIAITPDQAFLADDSTEYPVFVDPSYYAYGRKNHHVMVQSAWPGEHNFDRTDGQLGDLKAGYVCANGCFNSRSYVEMATDGMPGKYVHSATLAVTVLHSHDCGTAGPTQVWRTDGISPATTWASQPVWREFQSEDNTTNNWEYCPGSGAAEFPVTSAVRAAAANGWTNVTFGLVGKDEANDRFWRRFELNPVLRVWYNSYPGTPDQLATVSGNKNFPCLTGDSRPYLGVTTPSLSARFTDQDPGMLNARFYWGPLGQSSTGSVGTAAIPPGTVRSVPVPAGAFVDGVTYAWWVQAGDDQLSSPVSPKCEVGIDTTPPGAPTVSSTDYPQNSSDGFAGDTGVFTLDANGTSDVVKYVYTTDGNDPTVLGSPSVNATSLGGGATIKITAREGENRVRVRSVDRADNTGPIVDYVFDANAARPAVAQLPMDHSLGGLTYAGTGSVAWTGGYRGEAFRADPVTKDHLVRSKLVDTTKNYSVSAWARLDTSVGFATVLSQDGANSGAFALQYHDGLDRWSFRAASADAANAASVNAVSAKPPDWHVWTHLVGTYDANERKLRLYVNGVLEGEASYSTAWGSNGSFVVGAGKQNGGRVAYFTGGIDDVRVWDRVVGPAEAARLANTAVQRAHYRLDEGTGAVTREEISGQDAALAGDAAWDTQGYSSLKLTGNAGGQVTGPAPALVPGQSFTVSAWVRTTSDGAIRTVVGLTDPEYSPFLLTYNDPQHRWEFFVVNAAHTASWSVFSTEPVDENTWVHLTGVYDSVAQTASLYVNGQQVATQSGVTRWSGSGTLLLGGGTWHGEVLPRWKGLIDDVRLYAGVLPDEDIVNDMDARANGR
jgi:hypothetical protein